MNELSLLNKAFRKLTSGTDERLVRRILDLNEKTSQKNLCLSESDAVELAETRMSALIDNSRVEVGCGALEKLIVKFSESSFVERESWSALLNELIQLFYFIKTETHDGIGDNELIETMYDIYESSGGSAELLEGECERLITRVNGSAPRESSKNAKENGYHYDKAEDEAYDL